MLLSFRKYPRIPVSGLFFIRRVRPQRRKGVMDVTKSDRQRRLLEIISARRHETIPNLAHELGVSRYTVMRDLDEVTSIASFYTAPGRYGGGVYAVDGWYYSRTYLTADQEALLRALLPGLPPEDRETMQGILDSFARPVPRG